MSTKYKHLFSPIKVGNTEVPNRIAMMPMGVFSPRLMNQKTGAYTKDGADYYIERAKGGTGLIVTGLVPVSYTHLIKYRIEQLEKKVEKHNSVMERTFRLEEQMKVANHRIQDLENEEKEK